MNRSAAHLELTQHCKSTIFQQIKTKKLPPNPNEEWKAKKKKIKLRVKEMKGTRY